MKYFKIYTNACRVPRSHQEITENEMEEAIYNSIAMEEEIIKTVDDDEDNEEKICKTIEDFTIKAMEKARKESFYCGDYYIYAREEDFDMYDISRKNN